MIPIQTITLHQQLELTKHLVKTLFKNDDGVTPFEATDGQAEIIDAVIRKQWSRVQVIAPTQYGKSSAIAIGLILASTGDKQGYAVIAPSQGKADIIMRKVIQHTFDNEIFIRQLDFNSGNKKEILQKIKKERSKKRITWKNGGEIEAVSCNADNKKKTKETLMGLGKQNIIEDESALIPDDLQSTIMRMLGGYKSNFLMKIGNPFNRNHFHRTWHSDKYHTIFIDYKRALKEGRYTEDYIDEMRNEMWFDILYECKFPDENEMMPGGWRKLIKDELLESAFISKEEFEKEYCIVEKKDKEGNVIKKVPEGRPKLGGDLAGGGSDRTSYIIRWSKVMLLTGTNKIADTMQQVPIIEDLMAEWFIEDIDVNIDYGGLGQGVGDRLHELDVMVCNILFGGGAPDEERKKYKNMRAFMYYKFFEWLRDGGKIVKDDRFRELSVVNYKTDSERKFQIQPKEQLKKLLKELGLKVTSPDVADAGCLTFAESDAIGEDDFEII